MILWSESDGGHHLSIPAKIDRITFSVLVMSGGPFFYLKQTKKKNWIAINKPKFLLFSWLINYSLLFLSCFFFFLFVVCALQSWRAYVSPPSPFSSVCHSTIKTGATFHAVIALYTITEIIRALCLTNGDRDVTSKRDVTCVKKFHEFRTWLKPLRNQSQRQNAPKSMWDRPPLVFICDFCPKHEHE